MPLDSYFNPGSIKPQNGYQPTGALGGMYSAQDRQMYNQSMDLQQQMQQAAMQRQQMENSRYQQVDLGTAPAEAASRNSGFQLNTATNNAKVGSPDFIQSVVSGEMGDNQKKAAEGEFAQATNKGRIDITKHEQDLKRLDMAADEMSRIPSPAINESNWRKVRDLIPESHRHVFPENYTPEVPGMVKEYVLAGNNKIAEHRRKTEEIRETGKYHIEVGKGNNEATVEAARQRNAAHNQTLRQQLVMARTPDHMMMVADMVLSDQDLDPSTKAMAEKVKATAARLKSETLAKGQFDLSNPTGGSGPVADAINSRLNAGGGAGGSTHSMTELRTMYPGRTDEWIKSAYKKKYGVEPK